MTNEEEYENNADLSMALVYERRRKVLEKILWEWSATVGSDTTQLKSHGCNLLWIEWIISEPVSHTSKSSSNKVYADYHEMRSPDTVENNAPIKISAEQGRKSFFRFTHNLLTFFSQKN